MQPAAPTYSDTGRVQAITDAYKTSLGRDVDPEGLGIWYNNGQSIPDLQKEIANTPEARKYGVTNIYKTALGRAPDAAGLNNWTNSRDLSLDQISNQISGTQEAQNYKMNAPVQAADANAAALTGDLSKFDQSAQNPIDVYNKALSGLGISDARTRVSNLRTQLMNTENLLKGVDAGVTGRTQNSLVTEAQRQRLVAAESTPLNSLLSTQNSALGNAQADQTDILNQGKTATDYTVQGQTTNRQNLLDRLQMAIANSKTAEERRQWQVQYNNTLAQQQADNTYRDQQAQASQQKDASAQALDQAKLQELIRSNQADEANSRSKSSASSAKLSPTEQLASDSNATVNNLRSVVGKDGHVSNENWAKALNDWLASGRDVNDFWSRFGTYVNPTYKKDYAGYNQQKVM